MVRSYGVPCSMKTSIMAARMSEPAPDPRLDYRAVRATTEALCEPLAVEECFVQSAPHVSPTKWHLGHTIGFLETLVLQSRVPG